MILVGVIGAGASGLCATRHILATSGLTPIVWEQSTDLGGTWRLSEDVETEGNRYPVHSSMYQSLQTDLPKIMMAFPDFPFPGEGESFVHHTVVLKYLEDYAQHFDLLPWVMFGHHVDAVTPVLKEDGPPSWAVTVTDLTSGMSSTTTCDALLICNGHFTVPQIPHIEGIEKYKGRQLHSHNYREPSPYAGSRVVILGAAASGLDISLELSAVAKEVLLSHNLPVMIPSEFPPNIHQVAGVVKATEEGFVFSDGTSALADTIVYCTGYKYEFPFLSEECGIQVENNCVKPLYKHLIHTTYSSMAFIGIPSRIIVFPLINYQVQYFVATLTGRVTLPTKEEMTAINQKINEERKQQGLMEKHFHMMSNDQFQYMDNLGTEAGLDRPPPFLKKMWDVVITRLFFSFPVFKSYDYKLEGDGTIVETRHGKIINTSWNTGKLVFKQLICLVRRDFSRLMYLIGSLLIKKIKRYLPL